METMVLNWTHRFFIYLFFHGTNFSVKLQGSEGNELDRFCKSKYSCEKLKFGYQFKVWFKVSFQSEFSESETVVGMESLLGFDHASRHDNEGSHGQKLVPWLNWEEWNSVRQSLFSSSEDSVGFALGRV